MSEASVLWLVQRDSLLLTSSLSMYPPRSLLPAARAFEHKQTQLGNTGSTCTSYRRNKTKQSRILYDKRSVKEILFLQ